MTSPPPASHILRARWPIFDPIMDRLMTLAASEVPEVARATHARIQGPGLWRIVESSRLPGSGNLTPWTLVFDAPAAEATRRPYWADLP